MHVNSRIAFQTPVPAGRRRKPTTGFPVPMPRGIVAPPAP